MDDLQNIEDYIHLIRGHRVMLDRDIAAFYGVEAKRLNEKVKRNPKRFAGEDFMFQLTQEEYDMMKNTANLQPKWYDRNLKSVVETSRRILENQKQVGYRECQNINIW